MPDIVPTTSTVITAGIAPRRSSYTKTASYPLEMGGFAATGAYTENVYTGTIDDMEALYTSQLASGSNTARVTCTLATQDGGIAKLTVRIADYVVAGGGGGGGSDPGDTPSIGAGQARTNPTYLLSPSVTEVSILTTKLFDNATNDQLLIYNHLANGGSTNATIALSDGTKIRVSTAIYAGMVDEELVQLCIKSPRVMSVGITAQCSYTASSTSSVDASEFLTVQNPPGPIASIKPDGYQWLYLFAGFSSNSNGTVTITENYMLCEEGAISAYYK